jgi:hypothetical protein
MVHQAFPDLHAEVHDVIAEGELVAAPGHLHRHPPGRVRRHPRDREADHHQRGRSVPDAGRQAGRALGWAGHAQLPGAAGRHARTRHARLAAVTRRVTAAPPYSSGSPVGGTGASAIAWLWSSASGPPGAMVQRDGTATAGQGCVLGPRCAGDSRQQLRTTRQMTSVSAPMGSGPVKGREGPAR